jgi:sec-independent protein translocase protein TatB
VFNLQGSEIVVILLLALVVLGPEKLPDAIRRFGQTYSELKKMGSGFQSELKSALDEPMREMRETGEMLRQAADPSQYAAPPPPEAAEAAGVAEVAGVTGVTEVTEPVDAPEQPVEPGSTTVSTPGDPPTR